MLYFIKGKKQNFPIYIMQFKDKNGKEIKKNGVFEYTNKKNETKPYVYVGSEPHKTKEGLITVQCYYVDDLDSLVPRNMYPDKVKKITRLSAMFKTFQARYLNKKKK